MVALDRTLLRQHIEAVWGVRVPVSEQNELTLLPESAWPAWKLCTVEIASGRVWIWRPDVTAHERKVLSARLEHVFALPATIVPPPGISREVVFHLSAEPVMDLAVARQLARPLTLADFALVEAFQSQAAADLYQPEYSPLIGVIVADSLLCLAHSSRRTLQACELGIETLSGARRRGYALAATVIWSQVILQQGLTPIYSALAENTASLHLAHAAGYREFARAATVRDENG